MDGGKKWGWINTCLHIHILKCTYTLSIITSHITKKEQLPAKNILDKEEDICTLYQNSITWLQCKIEVCIYICMYVSFVYVYIPLLVQIIPLKREWIMHEKGLAVFANFQ